MANNTDLFIELVNLGRFENMRNAQRLSPSAPLPYNVPISTAAVPGSTVITSDFRRPFFAYENLAGTASLAQPIPYYPADPTSVAGGTQSAWAAGDVGSGIDTDFTDAADRTRYYTLGWESESLAQIGVLDGTLQPTGRLMEFGWDATATWKAVTLTQQTALQKIAITVPNMTGLTPPASVGVTTFRLTLWVTTALPPNAVDRRGSAMSYVGECALTGGSIIDGYSAADLGLRQYFPANLRNAIASRAVSNFGKRFFFMGNSIGLESREFTSENNHSVNDTVPKVRTGAANNILVLRRDASSSNKPYDPRVCEVTNAVVSGAGATLTITVADYVYFSDTDTVFIDDIGGITGCNGLTFTVSNKTNTTFQITGAPGTFSGTYTSDGEVALATFTIPDWWLGLNIAINGTSGVYTIIRVVTEGGTNTGIEIYPAVTTAITTNATFSIYGPQTVRFGGSDPRFKQQCAVGEDVAVEGRLRGPVTAGIASPDGNGVFVYSRTGGLYITNIARELPITGLAGGTPGTQPRIEDTPISYGVAGPNALAAGPDGTIIGWSPEMGLWIQQGASQQLLDPQQLFKEYYRALRYTATTAGIEDITPRIGMAYNQNENLVRAILPKQDQYFRFDFRTGTLCVDNMFAQKIQAIATLQVYAPLAWESDTETYVPDALANVGDSTEFAIQYGDIAEFSPSFTVDLARYYNTDPDDGIQYIGTVETVTASSVVCSNAANFSQKIANENAVISDTTLPYEQFPGTINAVSLSIAPDLGRYATITLTASRNMTIGGFIYVRGIGGITGINSSAAPATPTYWRITSVPAVDTVIVDSGANGTFTGTYTSGGTMYFLTFAERQGSYRITAADDNSGGATLDFTGELQWTAGAPLIGDIVTVQGIVNRYESTDIRVGTYGQIDAIDRFAMDDESTTGYAVQFRVLASGLGFTPIEADAATTAYSSAETAIGKQFMVAASDTGESVRVRVTWVSPPDGLTRLNSFVIKGHGYNGTFEKQIGTFPDSGTRANRQYTAPPDLNLTRDAEARAVTPRGGSRVLSVFGQSRPIVDGGSGGAAPTEVLDNAILCLRVGAQPALYVSTISARYAYEGFERGTVKIQPVLSLGTIRDAVPEATY